jgi:hypothetical protein
MIFFFFFFFCFVILVNIVEDFGFQLKKKLDLFLLLLLFQELCLERPFLYNLFLELNHHIYNLFIDSFGVFEDYFGFGFLKVLRAQL